MIATAFSSLVPMETEEAQIARGLRRRDPDLLDALIEQYQHRLLRYLLHLTGNRAVAEDLFQETWLRVLEKGHLYDGRNRFVTWLMSIAHNVAIDHLRKRNLSSLDEMKDPEDGAPFEPEASGPSPFDMAAAQQQQEKFHAALGAGRADVSRGAGVALSGADEAGGDCTIDPHSRINGENPNLSRRAWPCVPR